MTQTDDLRRDIETLMRHLDAAGLLFTKVHQSIVELGVQTGDDQESMERTAKVDLAFRERQQQLDVVTSELRLILGAFEAGMGDRGDPEQPA